jgi:amino acid adenylation domain-containing protein
VIALSDVHERLARLTPEQRAKLEARLLAPSAGAAPTGAGGTAIPRWPDDGGPAPLSPAQERMWFLHRFEPRDTAYHLYLAERLRGPLDVDRVRAAVATVADRHGVLRTVFPLVDGRPVQRVLAAPPAVRTLTATGDADARRIVDALVDEPFDLSGAPPVRVALVRLGPDDHVLCLVLHHICGDGWSLGVLAGDLSRAYRGEDLPPLPLRFTDVAAWQRGSGADPAAVGRARARLGAVPALALPTDRPRPPVRTSAGVRVTRRLGPDLTAALDDLARAERATPFMALLAGWTALLSRHSGQSTFCVGSPMADRDRSEVRDLVGCLTDTIVLRADLAGDPTFRDLLRRVRADAVAAFAERGVPLDALIAGTEPDADRDTGRTPVFQTMFNLQPARTGLLDLPDVATTPWRPAFAAVKTDVDLDVNRYPDDLELEVGASTALFDAGFPTRLATRLATLLTAAVADPDRPVSRLPLLDDAERRTVRAGMEAVQPYPRERLDTLVAGQAAKTPDAVAVIAAGRHLSFRDLDRRANGLAHRIRTAGAGPGDAVAVLLDRDEHLVVALLAVLKAGCHYVPLEPTHPPARLRDVVADARPALVLAREPFAGLPTLDPLADPSPVDDPPAGTGSADDPAYLIYTSGSTGRPKGVRVPHRGVVNLVTDVARVPGFGPGDRFLFLTSMSFDIAALEVFTPLLTGGALVVAPQSSVHAADRVADLIRDHGVTTVQAPPSVLAALLPRLPAGLPRVISGGEPLPADLADRLLDRTGELWNFYGPTETTIWSTRSRVRRGEPVTIGVPVANTAAYVLDDRRDPVPVGCVGELYLAGDGLADGYHDSPDLTAERFPADPFAGPADRRMYRTGDLARLRADGDLEFLGRVDAQVKVGGVRIEPGEIEGALAAHPDVDRAVVVLRDDLPAGTGLVAYVQSRRPDDTEALRGHLRSLLPAAMVPTAFVAVTDFPVLASGKLDRSALPAPDRPARPVPASAPWNAPGTDAELLVAEVFGEVLGHDRVGVDDDFFALGGTSLLAVRAAAELGGTVEVDVPLRVLFTHRTVRGIAVAVENLLATDLDALSDEEAERMLAAGTVRRP